MSTFYVSSEVGQLRQVLLHRPALSLKRLTPSNCHDLLFDDVLRVEKAGKEHDFFANTLREQGIEVLYLKELLAETIAVKEAKEWLLNKQISEYRFGSSLSYILKEHLNAMSDCQLATHLIGGLTVNELNVKSRHFILDTLKPTDFVLEPIPNHLFTRDTSCWIYGGVTLNPMAKKARQRETVHLHAIYKFHPKFSKADFKIYYGDPDQFYDNATIEGGDVFVLGNETVLIGMSERTTPQGVELLTKSLFKNKQAKKVIALQLPKLRSCMHLDTVFTQMDRDCFTYYQDIMTNTPCWELTSVQSGCEVKIEESKNFIDSIKDALGINKLRLIPTGGDIFEAEREQWNDANNVLAIRPGTVVTYERNINTIRNMEEADIEVLKIPGEDLGRGRGGARCMSCPIVRDSI